ncbi:MULTISPECIES: hypothetical protein [Catenuloplanes]|uniref:Uncharacterized protein n=1 Tax=Catenuloplanes niger TaxID=587534 RepID=A0AAE3ZL93_9ACTN|nr:hypothetical protein [Catenuloplanes niger]MDR7320690.1 hypothetical protein [Catenuloplanes niger]
MRTEALLALVVMVLVLTVAGAGMYAAAMVGPGAATPGWCLTPVLCRG